jgi:uncharacterized membrane protein
MLLCPYCAVQLQQPALFCPQCGGAIAQPDTPEVATETAIAASTERIVEAAPPAPVQEVRTSAPESEPDSPKLPLPENIAAVLSYLTIIPAVAFLYIDPFRRNRFVRFHAVQHLLLFGAAVAFGAGATLLWMILELLPFMRVLVFPFVGLISLGWLFVWLLLVVKAYHHEMFKLPWIGDYADQWSRG